ncbi:MAG: helix-turn-helix domain-containing protein [Chloroflexi bacterium OLB15]|nr:MAG: helix-turn-helix domain-containing protein [Chloroflexi bacterium OLB15]
MGNSPPTPPDDITSKQIQTILAGWGKQHFRPFPWRTPLKEWHGLIAEILLQRTRAANVIPVYQIFIQRFPLPQQLGMASVEEIENIIRPLGLHWRAPLLKKLGQKLSENDGCVPHDEQALNSLPGVGAYVTAAFLSLHAGVRSIIIDSNIVRFVGRLSDCLVDGETRRKKWLIAYVEALTPLNDINVFNYALLDFTMEVCTTIPKCDICPLGERYCAYRKRNIAEKTPNECGII